MLKKFNTYLEDNVYLICICVQFLFLFCFIPMFCFIFIKLHPYFMEFGFNYIQWFKNNGPRFSVFLKNFFYIFFGRCLEVLYFLHLYNFFIFTITQFGAICIKIKIFFYLFTMIFYLLIKDIWIICLNFGEGIVCIVEGIICIVEGIICIVKYTCSGLLHSLLFVWKILYLVYKWLEILGFLCLAIIGFLYTVCLLFFKIFFNILKCIFFVHLYSSIFVSETISDIVEVCGWLYSTITLLFYKVSFTTLLMFKQFVRAYYESGYYIINTFDWIHDKLKLFVCYIVVCETKLIYAFEEVVYALGGVIYGLFFLCWKIYMFWYTVFDVLIDIIFQIFKVCFTISIYLGLLFDEIVHILGKLSTWLAIKSASCFDKLVYSAHWLTIKICLCHYKLICILEWVLNALYYYFMEATIIASELYFMAYYILDLLIYFLSLSCSILGIIGDMFLQGFCQIIEIHYNIQQYFHLFFDKIVDKIVDKLWV